MRIFAPASIRHERWKKTDQELLQDVMDRRWSNTVVTGVFTAVAFHDHVFAAVPTVAGVMAVWGWLIRFRPMANRSAQPRSARDAPRASSRP